MSQLHPPAALIPECGGALGNEPSTCRIMAALDVHTQVENLRKYALECNDTLLWLLGDLPGSLSNIPCPGHPKPVKLEYLEMRCKYQFRFTAFLVILIPAKG